MPSETISLLFPCRLFSGYGQTKRNLTDFEKLGVQQGYKREDIGSRSKEVNGLPAPSAGGMGCKTLMGSVETYTSTVAASISGSDPDSPSRRHLPAKTGFRTMCSPCVYLTPAGDQESIETRTPLSLPELGRGFGLICEGGVREKVLGQTPRNASTTSSRDALKAGRIPPMKPMPKEKARALIAISGEREK